MKAIARSFAARSAGSTRAFTLIEILVAIGILTMVIAAIYSSWTAILRASKVGADAAAAVQRSRIAVRTIEDALLCSESHIQNQRYYGFMADNNGEEVLSLVARLPESFPRSGKFEGFGVRRISFSIESGPDSSRQLVMRQKPVVFDDYDVDEREHPLVLAKYASQFKVEFWDARAGDWMDEWKMTNQLPKLVKVSLKLADNANTMNNTKQQEVVRIVQIPANAVPAGLQLPGLPTGQPGGPPGRPGTPGAPGYPGQGQPGQFDPGKPIPITPITPPR